MFVKCSEQSISQAEAQKLSFSHGYLIPFSNDDNHSSDFMEKNWRPENSAMYMYIPSRFHIVFKVQLKL